MPRNRYISHGTFSEKNLLGNLIAEAISIYGHDVFYLPRKILKLDRILNEDVISNFPDAYMVEMYVESVDGFEGDGKLISKFGLEIRDQLTLVVSVHRWNQLVGRFGYPEEQVRPAEGDLIFHPMTKGLFEIKFVEDKKPFFQLNNTPTYKLIVELYEYPHNMIDTGVKEIDDIQGYSSNGTQVTVEYDLNEIRRIYDGDKVTLAFPDNTFGSCEVLKFSEGDEINLQTLFLSPITFDDGDFRPLPIQTILTESTHGIQATITEVFSLDNADDDVTFVNDSSAQNSSFEAEGLSWIDFSETNPFSEGVIR